MADELKSKGNAAFSSGNYAEAIKYFTEAIAIAPENHILYSNRSGAYASLGEYQNALNDANKCIELNPSFIKGYNRKATALQYLGRPDEAMQAYDEGLKIDPNNQMLRDGLNSLQQQMKSQIDNMFANMFQGDIWAKLNSNPETADFKNDPDFVNKIEQIRSNPALLQNYSNDQKVMAAILTLAGLNFKRDNDVPMSEPEPKREEPKREEPKKEEPKKAAPKKEVKCPEAENEKELGNADYKKKDFDSALAHYSKAVELAPDVLVYSSNKAACLIEMKRYDEVLEICEKCIDLSKEQKDYDMLAKFLSRQGSAYQGKGEYEKAISCFQKSLTEVSCAPTLNKLRKCESEFEKAKAAAYENPELAEQERLKGNEFFKQNNFPEAMKCYNEAIKRAPRQASLYSNRSGTYINLCEFALALKDAEKCIELDPTFVRGYARKGAAHFYMKEYVKALEAYQKGLDLDPENEECKRGLINVENKIRESQSSDKVDEQQIAHAMADPEIQNILQDPVINNVINDMSQHPETISKHLANPEIAAKIEKLIASGILRTGTRTQ